MTDNTPFVNPNRYKTIGQRLGAGIIDGLVFLPVNIIGTMIYGEHSLAWTILDPLLTFTYYVWMHGKYGQTLGKMALHIKVVKKENEQEIIGYRRAFIRDSVYIGLATIEILLMLLDICSVESAESILFWIYCGWGLAEILTALFHPKRRAVHDLLADSVVIDTTKYTDWEMKVMTGKI